MRCRRCHGAGFLLSILVHAGALAAIVVVRTGLPPASSEREVPVQLTMFTEAAPPAVQPVAAPPEPAVPEPSALEPPRHVEVPPPKPRPKPPQRHAPAPRPSPAEAAAPPAAEASSASAAPVQAVAPPPPNPAEMEHLRAAYLQRLVTLIDAHKFYPETARRRGLAGIVQVSFTLHRDGSVSDLNAQSGHGALRDAALESVRRALPLPPVPEKVACPLPVSYGMEFRLN